MPRRPPLTRTPFSRLVPLGVLALCAACSSSSSPAPAATGSVAVPVPSSTSTRVAAACRALTAALPSSLDDGVDRRPVSGDATRTAAWGDPPVTLRCGVPPGDPTQTPLIIDGVSLVTVEGRKSVTYTTVGRAVNAVVEIPRSYEEQAYLVQPLLPMLRQLP